MFVYLALYIRNEQQKFFGVHKMVGSDALKKLDQFFAQPFLRSYFEDMMFSHCLKPCIVFVIMLDLECSL